MSKEIKMSDLFNGKVIVDSSSGKVGAGCNEIGDDDGWIAHFGYSCEFTTQDSHEMATYAAHAINNHDRLVEENKRLRESLKSVTTRSHVDLVLSGIGANYSGENYENKLSEMCKPYIKAQKLLSELGGE